MAETQDLQKLIVSLEARTTQFEKQLAKATASANKQAKAIESRFQKMNGAITSGFGRLGSALGAIGISVGVGTLVREIRRVIDEVSNLVDEADRLGIAVETLQELKFAAGQSGVEFGELTSALAFFNKSLAQARQGKGPLLELFEANEKLGVSLKNADGSWKTAEQALGDFAELVRRSSDDITALGVVTAGMGKGSTAMVNLLRGGEAGLDDLRKAAQDLGIVMDEELARKVEEAGDRIDKVFAQIGGTLDIFLAKMMIGSVGVVDGINDMKLAAHNFLVDLTGWGDRFNSVAEMEAAFHGQFISHVEEQIKALNESNETARAGIKALQAEIAETQAIVGDATSSMIGDWVDVANKGIAAATAKLLEFQIQLGKSSQVRQDILNASILSGTLRPSTITRVIPPPAPPAPAVPATTLPNKDLDDAADDLKKAADKLNSASGSLADRLTQAIGAWETRGMTAAQAYAARGGSGEYGRYQIMPYNVTAWSKELYGHPVSHDYFATHPEIQDEIARFKIGQYLEQYGLEGAIRAWNTGQPGGTTTAGYVPGVMGMLESGVGFEDAAGSLKDLNEQLNITTDRFEEIRPLAENFLNTFVDGILEGKDAIEVLGDALEELGRSLIKMGIHQLVGAIFPTGAPLFAAGGNIYPGNVYKVHKDEMIVPRVPGKVIPASQVNQGGGGVALNYSPSIVIQGNADESAIRFMRDRILIDVEQRLPSMVRKAHANRTL